MLSSSIKKEGMSRYDIRYVWSISRRIKPYNNFEQTDLSYNLLNIFILALTHHL